MRRSFLIGLSSYQWNTKEIWMIHLHICDLAGLNCKCLNLSCGFRGRGTKNIYQANIERVAMGFRLFKMVRRIENDRWYTKPNKHILTFSRPEMEDLSGPTNILLSVWSVDNEKSKWTYHESFNFWSRKSNLLTSHHL